jgi:hypothetical protein
LTIRRLIVILNQYGHWSTPQKTRRTWRY